jgi:peptidoglycan/xylan/chitin deacetylase (PgdA/CDA1 family)
VTLTFDNGPWPGVTEHVLDALSDRDVAATFFVVGEQLQRRGAHALAERAAAEGHWIGNHTMTHSVAFGDTDDPEAPANEIDAPQQLIGDLAHPARWFRPFGRGGVLDRRLLSAEAVAHLELNCYSCVLWNSVPRDWEDVDGWVDRCLSDVDANDWAVVVVHDLPTGAMDHLPRLLDELAARDVDVVQDFPADCVPIDRGVRRAPIDHLMPFSRQ